MDVNFEFRIEMNANRSSGVQIQCLLFWPGTREIRVYKYDKPQTARRRLVSLGPRTIPSQTLVLTRYLIKIDAVSSVSRPPCRGNRIIANSKNSSEPTFALRMFTRILYRLYVQIIETNFHFAVSWLSAKTAISKFHLTHRPRTRYICVCLYV